MRCLSFAAWSNRDRSSWTWVLRRWASGSALRRSAWSVAATTTAAWFARRLVHHNAMLMWSQPRRWCWRWWREHDRFLRRRRWRRRLRNRIVDWIRITVWLWGWCIPNSGPNSRPAPTSPAPTSPTRTRTLSKKSYFRIIPLSLRLPVRLYHPSRLSTAFAFAR
jgi:hypothetical protein